VLADGGIFALVVPLEPMGISIKGDLCHVFRSREDVVQLVQASGFKIEAFNERYREFTGMFVKE
jgi:hypothetical protein